MRRVALRRLFRVVNGGTPTSEPDHWGGDIPWATPIDLARVNGGQLASTHRTLTAQGLLTGSRLVAAGSLVVSTRAPIGYVAECATSTAFNQGCRGLQPVTEVNIRYFRYQLFARADLLGSLGQGSTFVELSNDALASLDLFAPPLRQQRAIADYLDTETARIDALIDKKRRMIEILDERLEAEIRCVLRSLDAPWIPLKRRWRVIDCKHRTPKYLDEGYPVVSPGDATPGRLDLARCHRFVGEADYLDLARAPRRPERGSIIYSRNASIGIASYVDTDQQFCMGQDVCLVTSDEQNQLFLTCVLNSVGVDQLDQAKIGSTFNRVNIAQILELSVPCPHPEVQRGVARQLDARSRARDATKATLLRQIDLLVEHRQALITAAVSGELEIPGVAA